MPFVRTVTLWIGGLEFRLVGHIPDIEICGAGDVEHLIPVDALRFVGGHVIVRVPVSVIPYHRDVALCKRSVVAATYRTGPCTIGLRLNPYFSISERSHFSNTG